MNGQVAHMGVVEVFLGLLKYGEKNLVLESIYGLRKFGTYFWLFKYLGVKNLRYYEVACWSGNGLAVAQRTDNGH